jgi:flagellar biosynthetic protein FlhB
MAGNADRTEQPTPRRREKARQEGRFVVSRDFVSAVHFLAFVALVSAYGEYWLASSCEWMKTAVRSAFRPELGVTEAVALIADPVRRGATWLGAILVLSVLALCAHLMVTQVGISFQLLAPNFERLNPGPRLRNAFSQGVHAAWVSAVLLPLFGIALWAAVADHWDAFLRLPLGGLQAALQQVGGALKNLLWKGAAVFLVVGSLDWLRQARRHANALKMTKQEVRDELKEAEGNPQMKARIRRIQRELLRRRMMAQVATATAVVVNPTHYAVALRYEMESAGAPLVVAKGKNYLALRIKQKAQEHQVPIVENPPLAQALYQSVAVGQEIPPHLYRAVAEVLAYIYRVMQGQFRGRR